MATRIPCFVFRRSSNYFSSQKAIELHCSFLSFLQAKAGMLSE
jgi:hypothetical protein